MNISDGEKLIALMLCDIAKAQKLNVDFEPDFLSEALSENRFAAIAAKYTGWNFSVGKDPVRDEVIDHLDMWDIIEMTYKRMPDEEKTRIHQRVPHLAHAPEFGGYDGNSERNYVDAAKFEVQRGKSFANFANRDFNSGYPTLQRYRAMYKAFKPMRRTITGSSLLSSSQLITLLEVEAST